MATSDPLAGIPVRTLDPNNPLAQAQVRRLDPADPLAGRGVGTRMVEGVAFDPGEASTLTNVLAAQQQRQQAELNALLARNAQQATVEEEQAAAAAPTPEELQRVAEGNRGIFGALGDTALAIGSGLAQLVGTVGDLGALVGLADGDNVVSTFGREASEAFRGMQTEELQARRALRDQAIQLAEGPGGEFAAAIAHTIGNPSLLIDLIAETVPSLAGSWGTGALARLGVRQLGRATQREVSQTLANRVGLGGALASNVVQQSASVGGETYEAVMGMEDSVWDAYAPFQQLLAQGVDREEAKQTIALEQARDSALGAMTISAAAQALPGARVIERGLLQIPAGELAKPGNLFRRVGQSGIGRFTSGALGEGVSEAIEEGGGAYMGGLAQQVIDPTIDPTEGAGGAAGLGFAAGAALGGPINVLAGRRPEEPAPAAEAGDADADTPPPTPAGEIPGPGGLESEAPIEFPTGLDAMTASERRTARVAVTGALSRVNTALAKANVPMVDEEGNVVTRPNGSFIPMTISTEQFLADPDGVIDLVSVALGDSSTAATNGLVTARDNFQAALASAEQRAQLDIMIDDATRSAVRSLDDAGRQAVADAMGWDVGEMNSALERGGAGNPDAQPQAAQETLMQAIVDALTVARQAEALRQYEATQERLAQDRFERESAARAQIRQGLREDFTQNEAVEDDRFEQEQAARRLVRQGLREDALALDAERAVQEQAAQSFITGQDPLAAGQRDRRAQARANRLIQSGFPTNRDFNPNVVPRPTLRNPLLNAQLQQAFSRGDAGGVRAVIESSRQADARTILNRFNRQVREANQRASDPKR